MVKLEKGRYRIIITGLWMAFIFSLFGFCLYVYMVSTNFYQLAGPMPDLKALENPENDLASELYSADGVLLGKYFTENRTPVAYEDISPFLIQALIATEDIRFEKHSGIDMNGTVHMFLNQRGGSTVTQQLAKILFKTRGKAYKGKLHSIPGVRMLIIKTKEWITAIQLERNYTKKEIITMYLNTYEYGSNAFGIKVAAKTFFNKQPKDLTIEESAVIVGVLNNPNLYSPIYNLNNALVKRNFVLQKMHKYGYITQADYNTLKSKPIDMSNYRVENQNQGIATYFRSNIQGLIGKWANERNIDLHTAGLKIYTTLDSRMQKYAEEAVTEHMKKQQKLFFQHWKGRNPWTDENFNEISNYIETVARRTSRYKVLKAIYKNNEDSIWKVMNTPIKMRVFSWQGEKDTTLSPMDSIRYYKHFLHSGLMSMDPSSGHVKAWVGGINFKHFKYDHVRQGRRQPGSTFKPILYTAAIDNGYSPCFEVVDAPVTFEMGDTISYTPKNSDGEPSGERVTLRQAMGRSINTISAYLIKTLGPQKVVDYAKQLGITSPLEAVPSLCLGTSPVTLYELLGAYSTFVNSGVWTKPMFITRIEDKNGNIIESFPPTTKEVLSEETAYLMVHMLQGALQESGGTARGLFRYKAAQNSEIGGKTGTTQNHADGWFMGITPNLVTGIWVGGDDMSIRFRSMTYGQGSKLALPAWGLYMDKVYADPTLDLEKSKFTRPKNLSVSLECQDYHQVSDSTMEYVAPTVDSLATDGLLN